jgi:arylsulfatase A-like enzyme
LPIAFVLLLAAVEFAVVLGRPHPSTGEIKDAIGSSLLVVAVFGAVFVLSTLVPARAPARPLILVLLHVFVAALGLVLFSSWVARCVLGQPLNGDATRVLMESPVESILQLRESDPLFLVVLCFGVLIFLYVLVRVLHLAAGSWAQANTARRALISSLLTLIACLSAWRVANAELTWSSYATLLAPQGAIAPVPATYTCPQSAPVPIAAAAPDGVASGTPVIVLVIESLRSDLLRTHADALPFLSQLGKEGIVFDKAYATSSHSDFADLAFWYSRYPLRADRRLGYPVNAPWRGISAFEYFKLHGYGTAYFSSQDERWGEMINWLKIPAVDTFFDSENFVGETGLTPDETARMIARVHAEHTEAGKVEDTRTLQLAGDWIERHTQEPFFIGLNLQNTHFTYVIPKGGAQPFQPGELGFRATYAPWPAARAAVVRNRYLNAAFNIDAAVGRLAERLRRAGVWDRAIVLVVGDNGEAFTEHGYVNHGGPMFDEVGRTLAILKLPRGDARNGKGFARAVSHIDFVPLLAKLAGLPEWPGFQGRSPWQRQPDSPVFMTVNFMTRENAVVRWPWKLMSRTFPVRTLELYDLESDPAELHNQAREHPDVAVHLEADIAAWRTCQLSYYSDAHAHTRLHPPRF